MANKVHEMMSDLRADPILALADELEQKATAAAEDRAFEDWSLDRRTSRMAMGDVLGLERPADMATPRYPKVEFQDAIRRTDKGLGP